MFLTAVCGVSEIILIISTLFHSKISGTRTTNSNSEEIRDSFYFCRHVESTRRLSVFEVFTSLFKISQEEKLSESSAAVPFTVMKFVLLKLKMMDLRTKLLSKSYFQCLFYVCRAVCYVDF